MLWTISELMHMSGMSFASLLGRIEHALPDLEAGTAERLDAITSLGQYPPRDDRARSALLSVVITAETLPIARQGPSEPSGHT